MDKYQNEMYLIVIQSSLKIGNGRIVVPKRCMTLIGLDAVANYAILHQGSDYDRGLEWTVFGWDGHVTRELTDDEFQLWTDHEPKELTNG